MPSERHGEDQAERVDRPAQDRPQHPVPDQLHQEEREPDDAAARRARTGTGPRAAATRRSASAARRAPRRPARTPASARRATATSEVDAGTRATACRRVPSASSSAEGRGHGARDRAQRVDAVEQRRVAPPPRSPRPRTARAAAGSVPPGQERRRQRATSAASSRRSSGARRRRPATAVPPSAEVGARAPARGAAGSRAAVTPTSTSRRA